MVVTIEMGTDLTGAKNPKITLLSPSFRRWVLDASVNAYGNRIAVGKNIPLMSLSVQTDGIVEHEEGEYTVHGSAEMENFRLESEPFKLKLV